jgi:competence protein ComEC
MPRIVPRSAAEALAATAAATAATMPIAALHFGLVSFVGLAANLIAVPLTGIAVPAAAFALAADVVHPAAGAFLAGGAALPFLLLERTARLAAAVPGGHAYWGPGTVTAMLLAAGAFVLLLRTARGQKSARTTRAPAAIALCGAVLLATLPVPALRTGSLEVHVIDVGQGDAIAVRTPAGRWILIDAGPRSDRFDAGAARILPYLKDRGAHRIEVMILTHPHLDHIGGAPFLLRTFPVSMILDPAVATANESFYEMLAAARDTRVRWFAARAGREIALDGVTLSLLAPFDSLLDASDDPNDYSAVLRLGYGRFAALFTGDAPRSVENALVALHDTALAADLLKVGHHGSRTATGDSLLIAARPRLAIVSVGTRNRYGHPDPGVVDRLARYGVRVLRTDRNGSIVVRVAPDGEMTLLSER